jgi:hypothetical protein
MNSFWQGPPCSCCSLVPCRCQEEEPPTDVPCQSEPDLVPLHTSTPCSSFTRVVNIIGLEPCRVSLCANCCNACGFNEKYVCHGCKKPLCKTCQQRRPCCHKCYKGTLASPSSTGHKDAKRKNTERELVWQNASEPNRKAMYRKYMPNCSFCDEARLHFCQFCGAKRIQGLVLKQDLELP